MELARFHESPDCALMAITNSKSNDILAFFWDGQDIVPKWVIQDDKGSHLEGLNMFHSAAIGVCLEETGGRLQVKMPLMDRPMFLVQNDGIFHIVYDNITLGLCRVYEIYVDLSESTAKCLCRCIDICGNEFVESLDVDLGYLGSFFT